ncbi:hypothetical protein BDF19DRAFT_448689 [Syncephalis fuscata]|nr:hypothetical protein BDF19DRAFT_448689 [Syncephalis fuscata]
MDTEQIAPSSLISTILLVILLGGSVYCLLSTLLQYTAPALLRPATADTAHGSSPHRIYVVKTRHTRFEPILHSFAYRFFYFGLDLDALEMGRADRELSVARPGVTHSRLPWWFAYDSIVSQWWRPLSLCSRDYLGELPCDALPIENITRPTLKQKLFYRLQERNIQTDSLERVELVTTPRLFGYAMNPASFYYCYEPIEAPVANGLSERLRVFAIEVHNTFGETHLYAFDLERDQLADQRKGFEFCFETPREFHVSPFNPRNGFYEIHGIDTRANSYINARVVMNRSATVCPVYAAANKNTEPSNETNTTSQPSAKLAADVAGPAYLLDERVLAYLVITHPLDIFLTMPRILYEAWRLAYRHYLPIYARPNPMVSSVAALPLQALSGSDCMDAVHQWLDTRLSDISRMSNSRWTVSIRAPCSPADAIILPHSESRYVITESPQTIIVQLNNYDLYTQLVMQSSVDEALLTTYATGGWSMVESDKTVQYQHLAKFTDLFNKAAIECRLEQQPLPWQPTSSIKFMIRQWLAQCLDWIDECLETRLVYFVVNPFKRPARAKQLAQMYRSTLKSKSSISDNSNSNSDRDQTFLLASLPETGLPDHNEQQMHTRVLTFLKATQYH